MRLRAAEAWFGRGLVVVVVMVVVVVVEVVVVVLVVVVRPFARLQAWSSRTHVCKRHRWGGCS